MQRNEVSELLVKIRLTEKNREIATVEKCFGLVEIESEDEDAQIPSKTLDETITDFFQEIESKAQESGRVVKRKDLAKAAASLILFLVKRSQPELTLDIEVQKQETEEKRDADSESDT